VTQGSAAADARPQTASLYRVISIGHAFVRNLRHGHPELGSDVDRNIGGSRRFSPNSPSPSGCGAIAAHFAHFPSTQQDTASILARNPGKRRAPNCPRRLFVDGRQKRREVVTGDVSGVHGDVVATSEFHRPWRFCKISTARSPMVTQGAMVFPVVTRSMMDPSAIRRFLMP
jgi:hypothetical protein